LWQAEWVGAALARHGTATELVVIATRGYAEVDRPLHQLEGKGFFTREIEEALLDGRIDVAVHSLKDLPTELSDGLALGVVAQRARGRRGAQPAQGPRGRMSGTGGGICRGPGPGARGPVVRACDGAGWLDPDYRVC